MNETSTSNGQQPSSISRRRFFGYAGAVAGVGFLAGTVACSRDDDDEMKPIPGIDLGSGDTGILNYAYVLEQLEAAFYILVLTTPYVGMTTAERAYLTDIRDHEIAHRDFLKTALGSKTISSLTFNFSSIDFTSRVSVLHTARMFEDLGVSAYNGAGKYFSDPVNLTLAGKIVSVEARHSAIIRELLEPSSFADTSALDPTTRRDVSREPAEVLTLAMPFISDLLNATNLPTA